MSAPDEQRKFGPLKRAAAFSVHILTASGAAFGLLALLAAAQSHWALMFAWLATALVVDGVDGFLARRLQVRTLAPRWSGDTLDLVVDILTWVFVPAYAIVAGGLLPPSIAVPLGLAIMVTSALYFSDRQMKGSDNYFYGFPGAWNVVAFFLHVLRPDPWIGAAIVSALCVLTFVPVPFVHPFRVATGRKMNVMLLAAGAVLAAITIGHDLNPGPFVTVPLCALGAYFLGVGLLRQRTSI